ncbi:hypothetical protein HA402_007580 [Bradysia odoriphaga]|nr:hypothetical protein HA402_007580 [Bradysia odoriphaga]
MFYLLVASCALLQVNSALIEDDHSTSNIQRKGDLVFVHVLHRHGDRSPFEQYPGDKYDVSYWPQGWGQLTNLGKQQQLELGQWLRRRYKHFLSSTYYSSDVFVQSSDTDRTLMSAEVNLAGLFPPVKNQIWNSMLLWQPIPIHTTPVKSDNLLAGTLPECPSYHTAFDKYVESFEMKLFRQTNQPLYEFLSKHTGAAVSHFDDIWSVTDIYDAWLCQRTHNLSLPQWSQTLYPNNDKFYKAAMNAFLLPTATKHLSKFSAGFLLKDLLDRFSSKVKHSLQPDRKFFIYSTHDFNLFNLLISLNIFDDKFVPYAAAVIVELRQYKSEHYVQIFYKNSNETPDPIHIPGCGTMCPLSTMYELYDDILPKNNFATECKINE